ncbi:hypothetical protein [Leptospira mtsangambouensis]|uniref:hypothetical protein n=1 Tax=Leptospira mtsangambouensis TaxID=2484912 RepID=UPI001EEB3CAD|nr:hypothetical protein [Leptospira mtsangambouensis]MCG6140665.1 hypothetical protein [Leptospira mtsangambouensis]
MDILDPFTVKALIYKIEARVKTHKQEKQFKKEPTWAMVAYSLSRKKFNTKERTRESYEVKQAKANKYKNESEAGQWSRVAHHLARKKFSNVEEKHFARLVSFNLERKSFKMQKTAKPTGKTEDEEEWWIVCKYLAMKFKKLKN